MVQKADNFEARHRLETAEALASEQKKSHSSNSSLRGGGNFGWRRPYKAAEEDLQTIAVDPLPLPTDSSRRPFIFDPNPNFVFWIVFFTSGTFFYFFNNTLKNIKNRREDEKFNRIYHQQDVFLNNQIRISDRLDEIDKKIDKIFPENDLNKKP